MNESFATGILHKKKPKNVLIFNTYYAQFLLRTSDPNVNEVDSRQVIYRLAKFELNIERRYSIPPSEGKQRHALQSPLEIPQ